MGTCQTLLSGRRRGILPSLPHIHLRMPIMFLPVLRIEGSQFLLGVEILVYLTARIWSSDGFLDVLLGQSNFSVNF